MELEEVEAEVEVEVEVANGGVGELGWLEVWKLGLSPALDHKVPGIEGHLGVAFRELEFLSLPQMGARRERAIHPLRIFRRR